MLVLLICCISILIVGLDITILNVALPSLQRELNASISGAQWTIDAYMLVIGSFLMMAGSSADRFGRKRVFQAGLLIFTLGSALCSLAPSLGWLVVFRAVQAVGGSMLNPVAISIITNTFTDRKERARAFGAWGGIAGISMAAGPIIGGTLVDTVGWRAIFWMNIPIGIAAFALTGLFVPESKALSPRRADVVGQILVVCLLASLVYAIIEAPGMGWASPVIVACLLVAGVCFVGLIFYESNHSEPLIDPRFFRSAPFSGASIIALTAFAVLGGFLFLNTLYLQDVRLYPAFRAGLYILPMAGAVTIGGPVSGYIIGRFGPRIPLVVGAIAFTAAAVMFAVSGLTISDERLFTGYVLVGAGVGFVSAAITNTAVAGMPVSQAGVASAIASTMRQVGFSLGVAAIGSVLASYSDKISAGPAFAHASQICWWIIACCGMAVLGVALVTTGAWGRKTAERTALLLAIEEARV
jgi:EmrB/QacA subfamily drug resistance transporter